ncbi:TRAP transporter small permease [Clostridium butyricum]|uniref:TRAP transporter small permease n=1 Tax=Clostridium butyricum TaxID=1492 RepID=UPI0005EBEE4A|nr:TRAP transporter small permease [Clostridium butyricum]
MKLLNWLDNYFEELLMIILLILMTLIMGVQVCSRYMFNNSLSWSEEVTRYLFIWSGFISISYCTKKCISIKIEQFVEAFPKKGRAIFKIINHTIELIFFFYLMTFSILYLKSSIESGQVSPACGIPMYLVQSAPLIGFSLAIIRIIQRWIIEFKICREG